MGITEAEGGCCHTVAGDITTQREGRVSGNGKICDYLVSFVVLSHETCLSLSQALSVPCFLGDCSKSVYSSCSLEVIFYCNAYVFPFIHSNSIFTFGPSFAI